MGAGWLRGKLLYFAITPAIIAAVLVLGAIALRTTLQVEKARQQTVFDATLTLADERVDRLDETIIAQDNVAVGHADLSELADLPRKWLPTAVRETPTVMAILVLSLDDPAHDVLAFASRAPGPEAEAFRRTLVKQLLPQFNRKGNTKELRHLHQVIGGKSYLVSYWERTRRGRSYLVVAWHDVARIVHDVLPKLYPDVDRGNARMNVVDERGAIVFGPPIKGGEFTVGRPFPTTLYNWRLQVALKSAEELSQKVERQRLFEALLVGAAALVAVMGVAVVIVTANRERRVAALKGDFVANVSHELKTPLSLIRMFAELLVTERVKSEDKRKQYLSIIVGESERLTALIENVLDFAKVERGKAAYEFAPGPIAPVVTRAIETYRYRSEQEGVEVESEVDPDIGTATIDARAVELAVLNLLDNALKYAKDGGRIRVSAARDGDQAVVIKVLDWGPGISEADQAHVFERFVRGTGAQSTQVRGSGIGLALVQHIAEAHGGKATVRSPVHGDDTGCEFAIRLPARDGEGEPA